MAPAYAGDADNADATNSSFYKATFGRLLNTFGFKSADDEAAIKYRERPPLVIPSGTSLPPPEKTDVVSNPAWPKDPDITRAKQEAARERARPDRETERLISEDPKLTNERTLAPGPKPRGVQASQIGQGLNDPTDQQMSPSALGFKGGLWKKMFHGGDTDAAKFTGEPPRVSLTDPPPGYQTPSPDQPYGVGKYTPKVENGYESRVEPKH